MLHVGEVKVDYIRKVKVDYVRKVKIEWKFGGFKEAKVTVKDLVLQRSWKLQLKLLQLKLLQLKLLQLMIRQSCKNFSNQEKVNVFEFLFVAVGKDYFLLILVNNKKIWHFVIDSPGLNSPSHLINCLAKSCPVDKYFSVCRHIHETQKLSNGMGEHEGLKPPTGSWRSQENFLKKFSCVICLTVWRSDAS